MGHMKNIILIAVSMALIASADISKADEKTKELHVAALKVKSLAVFKNGLAVVFKTAETPLKDGWARLDQLPPASLGSLWIGTTNRSGSVTDVIAYKEKVSTDTDSVSLAELLTANAGRQVSITYLSGANPRTVEGELLPATAARKPDENEIPTSIPPAYASGWRPAAEALPPTQLVLLRSKKAGGTALLALNRSSIESVEIVGDANLRTKVEREISRTKVHLAGQPSHAEITVASLEKGIVWSPSYRINLADEKNASMELEAVLADDQEDLDNADVSFVVGYPHFLYADIPSPLSLQQSVASFLQALMSGGSERDRGGAFANVMNQSIAYNTRADIGGFPGAGYSVTTSSPGETSEDLYLYRKSGVTLKKGDRASFRILSTSVPYEHIYQWDVADTMNLDERGYRSNERLKTEDLVWHELRLKNTGEQPWTTAPARAMHDSLPVAQDTLSYTPPGGRSTLKLTVATDVHAEQSQTETARRQRSGDARYDEVTVAGKLVLTNWKNKEIALLVHKSLVGEVLESPDGKVTKVARNLMAVNSTSEIEWEFKLEAGKSRELNYQYKVLVNR